MGSTLGNTGLDRPGMGNPRPSGPQRWPSGPVKKNDKFCKEYEIYEKYNSEVTYYRKIYLVRSIVFFLIYYGVVHFHLNFEFNHATNKCKLTTKIKSI